MIMLVGLKFLQIFFYHLTMTTKFFSLTEYHELNDPSSVKIEYTYIATNLVRVT